jgi:hypothetical protein
MANVTVTYNATTGAFTFDPASVNMAAPGAINLNRSAAATWTFSGFQWCGTPQPNAGTFDINLNNSNIVLTDNIRDSNNNVNNGTFGYQVGIKLTATSNPIWSPDPDVDNDAPGLVTHAVAVEAKALDAK